MSAASPTVVEAISKNLKFVLDTLGDGQFAISIKHSKHLVTGTVPVQFSEESCKGEEVYRIDDPTDMKTVSERIKRFETLVDSLLKKGFNVQVRICSSKTDNGVLLSIPSTTPPKEALDGLKSFLNTNILPGTAAAPTATATAAAPPKALK